jgi:hypothetical protein
VKKTKKIDQAVVAALKAVEIAKSRIHALHYAMQGARERGFGNVKEQQEFSALHSLLYKNLNDAYRDLFMWGVVSKDAERLARKEAFRHYLREGVTIMQYLDHTRMHPSQWSAQEEKEFRAEIKAEKDRVRECYCSDSRAENILRTSCGCCGAQAGQACKHMKKGRGPA